MIISLTFFLIYLFIHFIIFFLLFTLFWGPHMAVQGLFLSLNLAITPLDAGKQYLIAGIQITHCDFSLNKICFYFIFLFEPHTEMLRILRVSCGFALGIISRVLGIKHWSITHKLKISTHCTAIALAQKCVKFENLVDENKIYILLTYTN